MKSYIDIEQKVWIESRGLANKIYSICKKYIQEKIYGIVNQILRYAASIVVEGLGEQSLKNTIQFFYISKGSLTDSLIIIKNYDKSRNQ